jgi:hypothetical protein
MTLTIPIQINADEIAMAFLYDSAGGKLEGLTVVDQDATSITVATRHFSDTVVQRYNRSTLFADPYDTQFKPGVDDWPFDDQGTYITPNCPCGAICLTELYYFIERRRAGGAPALRNAYDSSTLPADLKTPGFTLDDDDGLWITSATAARGIEATTQMEYFEKLLSEGWSFTQESRQLYATLAAMRETNEPQYLSIRLAGETRPHAVLAYQWSGDRLFVADPSIPGQRRDMVFDFGLDRFDHLYSTLAFESMLYVGKTTVGRWSALRQLFSDADGGTLTGPNAGFPSLNYKIIELDASDQPTGLIHYLDLNQPSEVTVNSSRVQVMVEVPSDFQKRVNAYRFGTAPEKLSNPSLFTLRTGDNILGFHVEGYLDYSGGLGFLASWEWAGFQWINLKLSEVPYACTVDNLAGTWRRTYDYNKDGQADGTDTDSGCLILQADGSVWDTFGMKEGFSWCLLDNGRTLSLNYPQGVNVSSYGTLDPTCSEVVHGRTITYGVFGSPQSETWWTAVKE